MGINTIVNKSSTAVVTNISEAVSGLRSTSVPVTSSINNHTNTMIPTPVLNFKVRPQHHQPHNTTPVKNHCVDEKDRIDSKPGKMETILASTISTGTTTVTATTTSAPSASTIATTATIPTQKGTKFCNKSEEDFYKDLQQFHERRGTPIMHMPKISGREVDLYRLYNEVIERGGFQKVNNRDEWQDILPEIGYREKCVNGTAALKYIYRRVLEKYERLAFFGEDPDKVHPFLDTNDYHDLLSGGGRGGNRSRHPNNHHSTLTHHTSSIHNVPMNYNYRQHSVNLDRRRQFKLSTNLYKPSCYEKLVLSLLSPLPNEQDFAINTCTLMANEAQHTLRINEYPKLLDALLAHTGVFSDHSMRELFEHVYCGVRNHSLYAFWRDLLYKRPQILNLYNNYDDIGTIKGTEKGEEEGMNEDQKADHYLDMDFFNLGRDLGTHDYVGQRILQIISILRNLSFFEENLAVLVKNRSFLRFLVMSSNIRWNNIHVQALEITGNIANELELLDPTVDDLSRILMATICEAIEGTDRCTILSCLEILHKLCQKDSNEDYILKSLNLDIYRALVQLMSLKDIMLLIYTLEAIYALTSLGPRSCQNLMQIRGIFDQLISLMTVEGHSYGSDGCILMKVVETIPGSMLPIVMNLTNLQSAAIVPGSTQFPTSLHSSVVSIKQQHQQPQQLQQPQPSQQQQQKPQLPPPPPQQLPNNNVIAPSNNHISSQSSSTDSSETAPVVGETSASTGTDTQGLTTVSSLVNVISSAGATVEDEQYALSWLTANIERTASNENHIEKQELYRHYVQYCQKMGKGTVVNHSQFPRLVRLIFTNNVGPVLIRRSDGTELPGFHYITIRFRAPTVTPTPIQPKVLANSNALNTNLMASSSGGATKANVTETPRKAKKKNKVDASTGTDGEIAATGSNGTRKEVTKSSSSSKVEENLDATDTTTSLSTKSSLSTIKKLEVGGSIHNNSLTADEMIVSGSSNASTVTQQTPSALIKSLLANKVNQRQQKQKDTTNASTSASSNIMPVTPTQPIKVVSTAISALVNNPLMQTTPVKVGQTTIKPLNQTHSMEKKGAPIESTPPPLAPLSAAGTSASIGCNGSGNNGNINKESLTSANGTNMSGNNGNGGSAVSRSIRISGHHMLPDITEKNNPSQMTTPGSSTNTMKRKLDESDGNNCGKRLSLDSNLLLEETPVTPSKNAANLYAEMAASILEDEDLDDIPVLAQPSLPTAMIIETQQHQQTAPTSSLMMPPKIHSAPLNTATVTNTNNPIQNISRQLVFQTASPQTTPQMKLTAAPSTNTPQLPNAMATIKTDQGLQTVPVILQQKPLDSSQPTAQFIQQVLQHTASPQPQQTTQYVLATNPQGQTYLLAQQPAPPPPPPPPTQTVLVTQTPQQQSTGTKTIIILQQQAVSGPPTGPQQILTTNPAAGGQKMIMTTPQGQQVLVTQRPPTPQQIFLNTPGGVVGGTSSGGGGGGVAQASLIPRQLIQTQTQTQSGQQLTSGHISPSLLNQLNQIPATIKLHQPIPATMQTSSVVQSSSPQHSGTIARLGKPLSIAGGGTVGGGTLTIPQLQQHPSIIQQHIISGGGATTEKRHVILGGGRAIEIKETLLTQSQTSLSQCQLSAQTIIKQTPSSPPTTPPTPTGTPHILQQQQQIRTIIEQQQHPSIIQQKLSVPVVISTSPAILPASKITTQQGTTAFIPNKAIVSSQGGLVKRTIVGNGSRGDNSINGPISASNTNPQGIKAINNAFTGAAGGGSSSSSSRAAGVININGSSSNIVPAITSNAIQTRTVTTVVPKNSTHLVQDAQSSAENIGGGGKEEPTVSAPSRSLASTTTAIQHAVTAKGANSIATHQSTSSSVITSVSSNSGTLKSAVNSAGSSGSPSSSGASAKTQQQPQMTVGHSHATAAPTITTATLSTSETQWLYICDWRNCPRFKFKSISDLQHHVCTAHVPEHLDSSAEIFCQWGVGSGLCDGIPRKRFALMTHLIERHLTTESLRTAVQRRIATGVFNIMPGKPPVTIVRNMESKTAGNSNGQQQGSSQTDPSALHAMQRHTADFMSANELQDEPEGPVTKSIRLTAALILRNLVTYTSSAKRTLRRYESHLANIALSNIEASGIVSNILFELSN